MMDLFADGAERRWMGGLDLSSTSDLTGYSLWFPSRVGHVEIVVSDLATTDGGRWFPESRHRSRRLTKKLMKRFGGVCRRVPASYRIGDTLVVHPTIMSDLQRAAALRVKAMEDQAFYSAFGGVPVRGRW